MSASTPSAGAPNPSRFKTASPPLSRGEILEAALRQAEAGGLDQLTVRKLADELDVTPMALYRHVRDKDDILEGVADALLAKRGLPSEDARWDEYLIELASSLRSVLRDHPLLVSVFGRRPQVGPTARLRLAAGCDVLVAAGYAEVEAVRVYAAVHTYTIGFCALEAGRAASGDRPEAGGDDQDGDGEDEQLSALIAGFVTEQQFQFGLRSLVRGLPVPHRRRPAKEPAPKGI